MPHDTRDQIVDFVRCWSEKCDLANKVVFITDSKTPTGVAEIPLTDIAVEAFRNQMELAGPGT